MPARPCDRLEAELEDVHGLDGVIVASLALMAVVTWQLGRAAIVDAFTAAVAIVAGGLLFTGRVTPAWLVAGGALAGYLSSIVMR